MTVFIAAPGTETLPVRMFLYIQDNIDPLVTSVSACVIAITVVALVVLDRAYGLERLLVGQERRPWPASDYDVAVVGGGLVGAATAWGLAREGCRVAVLDEGDRAVRASRGNFALVWVQSKGLGMRGLCRLDDALVQRLGRLRRAPEARRPASMSAFQRPGGFHLALSERRARGARQQPEAPAQPARHRRLQDRDARPQRRSRRCCPTSGPRWSAASYCPLDGHVNSLRLFRALHTAINARGVDLPAEPSRSRTSPREGGEFRLATAQRRDPRRQGRARRRQRQHAAGADGRARGADAARARPDRRHRAAAAVPQPSRRHRAPDRRGHGDDRRFQGREHRSRPACTHRRQRHRGRARGAHVPAAGATSTWCAPGARSAS